MDIYIYTKSGHNVGLNQVRRGAVLYTQLEQKGLNPILCTSDYRASTFAKDLGVKKGVGVDIIGNLPNIMQRTDILIFDSDEPSDTMRTFMNDYCSRLYEIGVDIPKTIVSNDFFKKGNNSIEKTFFFGDDDYKNILLNQLCDKKSDINLLMGHYFFLGDEEKLKPYFTNIIDEENYFDTIINTKYLLTSSLNAIFESLASGNKPVFYQREDKNKEDLTLIKEYNIPIANGKNMTEIINDFENIIKNYPKIKSLEKVDTSTIIDEISQLLKLNRSYNYEENIINN
jgi:hypothetical protein